MTDEHIIGLFFERSELAIDRLDESYGRLFRKLARDLLGDERDCEECISDAYLAVWSKIPPEHPQRLSAYVCKIVRNIALKRYYANNAEKRRSSYTAAMDELAECIPSADSVEDEFDARELPKIIEGFLDTLGKDDRAVFIRRYWMSESYSSIAKNVGISQKNVSVRLTRIRKRLKDYLKEREVLL